MDIEGNVYVIEANVNADLTAIEDFAEAAEAAGLDYGQLLQRILNVGIGYKSLWKVEQVGAARRVLPRGRRPAPRCDMGPSESSRGARIGRAGPNAALPVYAAPLLSVFGKSPHGSARPTLQRGVAFL